MAKPKEPLHPAQIAAVGVAEKRAREVLREPELADVPLWSLLARAYLIGVQDGWETCSDAAERDRKEALERGREGGGK